MKPPVPTDPTARYRPLGAFRFGLSLLVVLQHFQHLLAPGQRWVFDRLGFGVIAVTVFFVVSGFVVAEANSVFYAGRPWAFLGNRLIRLVPPYVAALALSVAVHAVLWRSGRLALWDYSDTGAPVTPQHVLAGVAGLLPGLQMLRPHDRFEFIPFTWSLRVEMAFYLAACGTLLLARRARARSGDVVACALAAGLLASLAFLTQGRPGLLSDAPMFLFGTGFYLVLCRDGQWRWLFLAATGPALALGFASLGQHGHPIVTAQLVLVAALLIAFAVLVRREAGGWRRWDRRLGNLSYPLYLNHYVVGIGLADLWAMRGLLIYGTATAAALAVAAAMDGLVDGRLTAWRDRVRRVRL